MKRPIALLLLAVAANAHGATLSLQPVVENVFALIGPMGARSYENDALNANVGFIVTPDGVILIDSGASRIGAQMIETEVRKVTPLPIKWVINTGAQDHRWLGNAYFAAKGVRIVALKRTVQTQQQFAGQFLESLRGTLKARFEGTVAFSAPQPIDADDAPLQLGGVTLELHWLGDAHFVGDAVVWMPQQRVMFTGDLVFVDRMLGVLPMSRALSWRAAFHAMEKFAPVTIVPGHGQLCDLAHAKRDTGDYLDWIVGEVQTSVANWDGLDATVERLGDEPRWKYLENYDLLHRGNINRTYVQIENGETGATPIP